MRTLWGNLWQFPPSKQSPGGPGRHKSDNNTMPLNRIHWHAYHCKNGKSIHCITVLNHPSKKRKNINTWQKGINTFPQCSVFHVRVRMCRIVKLCKYSWSGGTVVGCWDSCADPVRGGVGWTPMVGQYCWQQCCAVVQLYSCADPARAGWCWLDNRAQQEGRGCQASRPVRGQ